MGYKEPMRMADLLGRRLTIDAHAVGRKRITANQQALRTKGVQRVWPEDGLEALTVAIRQYQASKAAWQCDPFKTLIENNAKPQAVKAAWKGHTL